MDNDKQVNVMVNSDDLGHSSVDVTEKRHIIELKKTHEDCYETINIMDFVQYLTSNFNGNFVIYYNIDRACAYQLDTTNKTDVQARCIAKCSITPSKMRSRLWSLNGKILGYTDFQDFLNEFRKVFSVSAKDLLTKMKDFRITKETKVQRLQGNNGDFVYIVERKGKKGETEFPDTIGFTIPILDFLDDEVGLDFDFIFSYTPRGDDVEFGFKIMNYNLGQILIEETRRLLEDKLPKDVSFFGNLSSSSYNDSDKYKIVT